MHFRSRIYVCSRLVAICTFLLAPEISFAAEKPVVFMEPPLEIPFEKNTVGGVFDEFESVRESKPEWEIERIRAPNNLRLEVTGFHEESNSVCVVLKYKVDGQELIYIRDDYNAKFHIDIQSNRKLDCTESNVLAFRVLPRFDTSLLTNSERVDYGTLMYRVAMTAPSNTTTAVTVADIEWRLEVKSENDEWFTVGSYNSETLSKDANPSRWIVGRAHKEAYDLLLSTEFETDEQPENNNTTAKIQTVQDKAIKIVTGADLTKFYIPENYNHESRIESTSANQSKKRVRVFLRDEETASNIYLQVVMSNSKPDKGGICVRPLYVKSKSRETLSVRRFIPEKSSNGKSILWVSEDIDSIKVESANNSCQSSNELMFNIHLGVANEQLSNLGLLRFRLISKNIDGQIFHLKKNIKIELLQLDSGKVLSSFDPSITDNNTGWFGTSENEESVGLVSMFSSTEGKKTTTVSAISSKQKSTNSRVSDGDQLIIRPMLRFGSFTKALRSCVGHLESNSGVSSQDFSVMGSLQKITASQWGGMSEEDDAKILFSKSVGSQKKCNYGGLSSESTSIQNIMANSNGRATEVIVDVPETLFVGYIQLNAEAYRRSLGRWRQVINQANSIYKTGRSGGNWVDGLIYGAAEKNQLVRRLEPVANFSNELGDSNKLLASAESWLENTDNVRRGTFGEQLEMLAEEVGQAEIALYYFDDLPLSTSCDYYKNAIDDAGLNVKTGVVITAFDGNPEKGSESIAGGAVEKCMAGPIVVYSFNWRERMLNLDWDKVFSAISDDM